jgi:hypothetical protein
MQIKIYVEESFLDELSNFLRATVPYEHSIIYFIERPTKHTLGIIAEVSLFYDDYVQLKNMKIES